MQIIHHPIRERLREMLRALSGDPDALIQVEEFEDQLTPISGIELLLRDGHLVTPRTVQQIGRRPGMECHGTTLAFFGEHRDHTPFFGWSLCDDLDEGIETWCSHSFLLAPDGTLIDPSSSGRDSRIYWGRVYDLELIDALGWWKSQQPATPREIVKCCVRRSDQAAIS